jgi:dTDP-4-amino-4,6-dideoxygalactose transaminase
MHLQPLFARARRVGGAVAEELFRRGLCLPSGSALTEGDIDRVVRALLATPRTQRRCRLTAMPQPLEEAF